MGGIYTYSKTLFVVYMKLKFYWVSWIFICYIWPPRLLHTWSQRPLLAPLLSFLPRPHFSPSPPTSHLCIIQHYFHFLVKASVTSQSNLDASLCYPGPMSSNLFIQTYCNYLFVFFSDSLNISWGQESWPLLLSIPRNRNRITEWLAHHSCSILFVWWIKWCHLLAFESTQRKTYGQRPRFPG